MVKVQAPALSLDASGQLGGALVFSKWKGRSYVRTLVKPSNPKSGGQLGVRAAFKFLSQEWADIAAEAKAAWEDLAEADIVSTFNAYMKFNLLRNRNFLGLTVRPDLMLADAPDAIDDFAAVAGERQITIELSTLPVVNGCWGFLLYRSTSTGFTPSFDNLIAIVPANGISSVYYVDTPLDPDTYYYDAKPMNDDASLGALDGEINATVA